MMHTDLNEWMVIQGELSKLAVIFVAYNLPGMEVTGICRIWSPVYPVQATSPPTLKIK